MTDIYVRFTRRSSYGFKSGDIIKGTLTERDKGGIYVIFDSSPTNLFPFLAWSDLSSFEEISAMELLALAADGKVEL